MKLTYETDDQVQLSVAFDRWDCPDSGWETARAQWTWTIAVAGETLATASDLRSGADGRADAAEALGSLASFLSAWDESWSLSGADGENASLFPASLRDFTIDWETISFELSEQLGKLS